jgi:hypothetical protein
LGDGNAPGYLQLANIWMILNVGGGPTPDKPTGTLSVPDPNHINSFMNFRVADIQACYELWKSRGAKFITEPIPKYGETRCYIRDPDRYIIEVGQSQTVVAELGTDLANWFPTEYHFASWLGLTPRRDVSGRKVIRHTRAKNRNHVAGVLRMAANSLLRSDSYLGARYRNLRTRLGSPKAIKAMARYLACNIYRLFTKGQAWVDRGASTPGEAGGDGGIRARRARWLRPEILPPRAPRWRSCSRVLLKRK